MENATRLIRPKAQRSQQKGRPKPPSEFFKPPLDALSPFHRLIAGRSDPGGWSLPWNGGGKHAARSNSAAKRQEEGACAKGLTPFDIRQP